MRMTTTVVLGMAAVIVFISHWIYYGILFGFIIKWVDERGRMAAATCEFPMSRKLTMGNVTETHIESCLLYTSDAADE